MGVEEELQNELIILVAQNQKLRKRILELEGRHDMSTIRIRNLEADLANADKIYLALGEAQEARIADIATLRADIEVYKSSLDRWESVHEDGSTEWTVQKLRTDLAALRKIKDVSAVYLQEDEWCWLDHGGAALTNSWRATNDDAMDYIEKLLGDLAALRKEKRWRKVSEERPEGGEVCEVWFRQKVSSDKWVSYKTYSSWLHNGDAQWWRPKSERPED